MEVRRKGGDEVLGRTRFAFRPPPWPRVSCLPAKPDRARSLRHALVGLSQMPTVVCEGAVAEAERLRARAEGRGVSQQVV